MPQTCWRGGPIIFAFVCSGCPLEGYPAMQLRALLAHRLLQRLQRYHRHTQRSARCHNHTNAGMQPGGQWHPKSLDQPSHRGRELARLLEERLLGRLWRARQGLFVVTLEPITARDCRFACETYSGWDCCSCSGCGPRKSKFIIEIRVLQGACLPVADSSSIAICTPCLLPWYLPQSRSRSDWRLGGDR